MRTVAVLMLEIFQWQKSMWSMWSKECCGSQDILEDIQSIVMGTGRPKSGFDRVRAKDFSSGLSRVIGSGYISLVATLLVFAFEVIFPFCRCKRPKIVTTKEKHKKIRHLYPGIPTRNPTLKSRVKSGWPKKPPIIGLSGPTRAQH